ncbi:MAG: pilus assembly protein [Chloroflexi bacterium]|nr:pilus assembly protein [Chloroflexota bacterium]
MWTLTVRRNRHRLEWTSAWRSERGAALVEYLLILPLVLLLFLGSLEVFRVMSVKQSLRTGLKMATPCLSHWRDEPNRCNPYERLAEELDKNPFAITIHRLELTPSLEDVSLLFEGEVFEVTAELEIEFGFLYPFEGGPTITLRESAHTFIDSSPSFYKLNAKTPFPQDPGALPQP